MCNNNKLNDPVNHPSHYLKAAILVEPIELTSRLDSCLGQAVNYIVRAPYKGNEREDLQKAIFYLTKRKELLNQREYTFDDQEFSEVTLVLGQLFAKNSANPLTRAALTELFKWRCIHNERLVATITVIGDWLTGLRGFK